MRPAPSFVVPLVVSLVWLGAAVLSAVPAMMSVMLFDAPGSAENGVLWWLVGSVWAFPVLAVVAAVGVWFGWAVARRRGVRGGWWIGVPAVLPLLAAISGGAAFGVMVTVCGGGTRCG